MMFGIPDAPMVAFDSRPPELIGEVKEVDWSVQVKEVGASMTCGQSMAGFSEQNNYDG